MSNSRNVYITPSVCIRTIKNRVGIAYSIRKKFERQEIWNEVILFVRRMRPRGCISGGTEIGLMTRLKGTVANCMGHKVGVLSYDNARFTHHYVFKFTAHCRGPPYDKPFNRESRANQSYVAHLNRSRDSVYKYHANNLLINFNEFFSYIITSTIFLLISQVWPEYL